MNAIFWYNQARSGAECPFRRSAAEAMLSFSKDSFRLAYAQKKGGGKTAATSPRKKESAETGKAATVAAERIKGPELIRPEAPIVSETTLSLQTEISKKADIALEFATRARAEEEKKTETNKELSAQLQTHIDNLRGLGDLERQSKQKSKKILQQYVEKGLITMDEAQEILDLHVENPEFEARWKKLTHELEGPATKRDLATIKGEAYEYQKLEKRFQEELKSLSETSAKLTEAINKEVYQREALDRYSRSIGFDLKEGTVVRFRHYRIVGEPDGSEIKEPIYRTAAIKDVFFEDEEITDEKGKVTGKIPSFMPMVALQFHDEWRDKHDAESGGIEFMSAQKLKEIADAQGMVEIIEERQDTEDVTEELKALNKILGTEIKEGDEFEYRTIDSQDGKMTGENRKVQIVHIHKMEDPFFNQEHSQRKGHKTTYIELSHPVVVTTHPIPRLASSLTLGEFAKWYKRLDAMKPLTFKQAREKLLQENMERNKKYERKEKMYPPIDLKEGEVLYYETDPPKTFAIKTVDEGRNIITFDNGSEYTPATFVAWVKQNQVEKMTAEAQAHKMTAHIPDGDPRKNKALKEAESKAEKDIKGRENPPKNVVLDNDNEPAPPHVSYFRQLWNRSYFLSLGDLYELGKEAIDFIKRTMQRRQKNAIGAIGHAAFTPFWGAMGAEFKALQQQAENERVQRFNQSYEQYGYGDLYNQLRGTRDKDELKSLLQTMSGKGWINWNDPVLWDAISRVGRKVDASFYLNKYDEQRMAKILDAFWGDNSYFDFKQKNDSSFNSKKNTEKDVAAGFENDPSGRSMKMRMQELLHKHLQGEWVEAAQYEAYLEYAIATGKLTFSDKVYFMVMGIGAEGPADGDFPGRTLMDTSRIGRIAMADRILTRYPIIDFFANSEHQIRDADGNPITDKKGNTRGKIDKNTYKHFIRQFIEKDGKKSVYSMGKNELTPGQRLTDYIERTIFYDPVTEERLLKSSGDVGNWDHDDFHEFAPQLDDNQVEQLTTTAGGGQKASPAAIKNAIAGFNHFIGIDLDEYMKAMKEGDTEKANKHLYLALKRVVAFEKLHAILDRRFYHDNHDRTHLGNELKAFAGVDKSRLVTTHMSEINDFLKGLIHEMMQVDPESFRGIGKSWDIITSHQTTRQDKDRQTQEMIRFLEKLKSAISALTQKVGSQGVYEIIARVQGSSDDPRKRLVKGILQRAETKEDSAKTEQKRYSFEYGKELEGAKDTVNKIDQLRLRLEIQGGRPVTQAERDARKREKIDRLMKRIKMGEAALISDDERTMLEQEVQKLEQALGTEGL